MCMICHDPRDLADASWTLFELSEVVVDALGELLTKKGSEFGYRRSAHALHASKVSQEGIAIALSDARDLQKL